MALSASSAHDLIAQSVIASERNSVSGRGFKSHSGQLFVATSKNPSVIGDYHIYIYIYMYIYIYIYIKCKILDIQKIYIYKFKKIYSETRSTMQTVG